MNQTLNHITDLKELSLMAWRIRKSRIQAHENQVHRQIMGQIHDNRRVN